MAAESNILSWTPANWLTVLLMVGLGWLIAGALIRTWQKQKGQGA